MPDENLHSINKLQTDVKAIKLFSGLLPKEKRTNMKEIEEQLSHMTHLIDSFSNIFSNIGWCAYDSMNMTLMENAITAYESYGIDAGEKVLIEYYKTDVKDIVHWLKNKSETFMQRHSLIQKAFDDHFAERYYASVPLFLIIIDGAVNDYTKSKGFFAEGTDVTAWDCLVGCSANLTKLRNIFNIGRNKTTIEEIRLPYRNGILHGRDLNYGNEYVSCKCVALMFALADWMSLKNNEEQRKAKYEKESTPPPIAESIKKMKQNDIDRKEIEKWQRRNVIVGDNIDPMPCIEECSEYPYLIPLIQGFSAWNKKNYGELSSKFQKIFSYGISEGKRAGECRKMFFSKEFISFEIIEIEERACSLTRILVQVQWKDKERVRSEPLEFGCAYQERNGNHALPWRGNGEWILIPWKIQGLYK
ncbi:MAG: hypothetical protein VB070_13665 [Clostridiaceae bacterium]|nr:hypothetical protein [Clostridiaceae bacterium]